MFSWPARLWNSIPKDFRAALALLAILLFVLTGIAAFVSANYNPKEYPGTYESQPERPSVGEATDERLAYYTLWLMIFTGVLAFGTLALLFVTWRTLVHAREDSERQAIDMRKSIAATRLMAANIARTQRPYLTITGLKLIYTKLEPASADGVEMATVSFEAAVTNVGKGPAFPLRADFEGDVGPRAPGVTGFSGFRTPRTFIGEILPEGGILPVPRLVTVTNAQHLMAPFVAHDHTFTPFFVGGWIRYRDIFGITRETGFRFIHSRRSGQTELAFYPTGGPQYWFDREIPEDDDA